MEEASNKAVIEILILLKDVEKMPKLAEMIFVFVAAKRNSKNAV